MSNVPRIEVTLYRQLIIYSPDGTITYQGKPDNYAVDAACLAPDGNVLVLLKSDMKKYGSFHNLILMRPNGTLIWRAELPDPSSGDAYVEFHFTQGQLLANSWSGQRVEIDLHNGKLLRQEFAK